MAYPKFTVSQEKISADVFEGDVFYASVFSATVADDGIITMFVKTKAQGIALSVGAEASGLSVLEITEGASLETAGTDKTLSALNRVNQKTSTATISHASSWSNGSVIYDATIGYSTVGNRFGGGGSFPNLFILAGSEHYNLSVQNVSGGSASVLLALAFTDVT